MKTADKILQEHAAGWLAKLSPEAKQDFIDAMQEFAKQAFNDGTARQRTICGTYGNTGVTESVLRNQIRNAPPPEYNLQ